MHFSWIVEVRVRQLLRLFIQTKRGRLLKIENFQNRFRFVSTARSLNARTTLENQLSSHAARFTLCVQQENTNCSVHCIRPGPVFFFFTQKIFTAHTSRAGDGQGHAYA